MLRARESMSMRILVVDDEPSMRDLLGIMLRKEGFEVVLAESRAVAAAVLARGPVEMVITDLRLPDGDGIEILRHVRAAHPDTAVLVMTAYGTTQTAVAALKLGAQDYLIKPFEIVELKIVVHNALESQRLHEENRRLRAEVQKGSGLDRIVGSSPSMQKMFHLLRSVASTNSTLLITGESGTGKELVARAVHELSPRRDAPFVSVNCAALPEALLESELFGHMKGAFTDAHQTKKGLFETAHRGTLMLDEVGETSLPMQAKLLRALQEKRVRRVGATEEVEVDVRVVAATNRPLEAMVKARTFREDLYYRLNVIPVPVPALRDRVEDIPLLADFFLRRFVAEMEKDVHGIAREALQAMMAYPWPGNVRELENAIQRAVAFESGPTLQVASLPDTLTRTSPASEVEGELPTGFDLDAHLLEIEARIVRQALDQAQGDRTEASRLLGISPRSLRYLLGKHRFADA